MEAMLPDDAWVLGVDEHTAVIMDLDARTVSVTGRGGLTVRRRGASRTFAAGEQLTLDTLQSLARGETSAPRRSAAPSAQDTAGAAPPATEGASKERSPLLAEANRLEQAFGSALESRKAGAAAEAILHLDRTIQEWAADSLQSDEPERARAILYSLIARLGEAASAGVRDPRERLAPLVESLITLRKELRAAKAYELADRVRDRLIAAHIEVRDTPAGTEWDLRE
jgi:cysteinyl-tRNA synthetase